MITNSPPTIRRQPDSWNTTSATIDYSGGNYRLVSIGSSATATVRRDFATNASEQHTLEYNLALLNSGSATVKVQQLVGSSYVDIAGASQSHSASDSYTLTFTPTQANIRVVVSGTSRYALTQIFLDRTHLEEVTETYMVKAGGYRYGFQGQEKDDEIKGSGNSYDFGNRMHDPRLGRFLSQDKFTHEFASETPYSFAGNSPILFIDMNGDFKIVITEEAKREKGAEIKIKRFEAIIKDLPNYLEQNPRVLDEIVKQTGLSKEQVMKDAVYGSGPVIKIGFDNSGASAPSSNEISMDYTFIDFLEGHKGATPLENAALDLIVGGIVLHEYTHAGDRKTNNGKITGAKEGDIGKQKSTSKYKHRGHDVEAKILGTIISVSGDVTGEYRGEGLDRDWYRTGANFHIEQTYIQIVTKKISLDKIDTTQPNPKKMYYPKTNHDQNIDTNTLNK